MSQQPVPAPEPGPLLEVTGLRVTTTGTAARTIVDGVGLNVDPGECVGIVGESGSGKSLTLRAVVGLLPDGAIAPSGSVRLGGEEQLGLGAAERHAARGRRISLLLQDPFTMLHPLRRCGVQIADGLREEPARRGHGGRERRAERAAQVRRRLAEVGLDPAVAERYPHELSGGMRQRVAIAAALAADPDLLIADEPTTALDAVNQGAVLDLLHGLRRSRRMGLVLVTHDLRVAFSSCDRVYVMYAGLVLEQGPARLLQAAPRHPYTAGLLASEPSVGQRFAELPAMPGSVPAPGARGEGCPFAARCPHVAAQCRTTPPTLAPMADGPADHLSACLRLTEIGPDLTVPRVPAPDAEPAPGSVPGPGPGERPGPGPGQVGEPAPALRFTGIGKSFHSPDGAHRALDGVTLDVPRGSVTALVGESGSGKTTLARIAIGLETFDEGAVEVEGTALTAGRLPNTALRRALASRTQIVFQDPYSSLNPLHTVGATIREALAAGRDPGRAVGDAVADLLTQVGLPPSYAARRPSGLSGGERQRVAIARALAARPQLLICDESVSALDVSVQAQILNLLVELRNRLGFSVLFITHDIAVVRQIADHVHVLYRGRLVESGPAARVLDAPREEYTRTLLAALTAADGTA